MALAFDTVTNSIAALSVSGLTIKDVDEIPTNWDGRNPVIYPDPVDFITDMTAVMAAFGTGSVSRWDVSYTLTYVLLYARIGSGRGMEKFAPAVQLAMDFVDAILINTVLTGAVTVKFEGMSTPGPVTDPAGNSFFGVRVRLRVMEFVN